MTGMDTCRPGDDTPAEHGGGICGNTIRIHGRALVCDRNPHKAGQHVASGPVGLTGRLVVLATWRAGGLQLRIWGGPL